jgi:hypothetical protein
MSRLAAVLRWTVRIIIAVRRRTIGCLLIAAGCKFAALLAKAGGEANILRFLFGFFLGRNRSLQGREAVEKQLGNVGQGNGVTAGDAFAGELLDEIAEEEIHGTGGREVLDVAEEVGGEGFGIDCWNTGPETVGVVGAERRARGSVRGTVILVDQHVAALAFRADMLALGIDSGAN